MPFNELYRCYHILKVFLQYGLDDLLVHFSEKRRLKWLRYAFFWIWNRHKHEPNGVRLRQALESLGPVWIKFGQMLSTRRDLFDAEIADQLALLQDNVPPFPGEIARHEIEKALGGPIESWFADFDVIPLASASIAQVHTATLLDEDKEVVLKIIRPNIQSAIKKDIRLMYRLARWLPSLLKDGERLRAIEVVEEYERTLLNELDLKQEAHNTLRLKQNFFKSPLLYIPKVYQQFSHEKLMVSERIYGVPISDIATLKQHNTNLKLLAERGVQTFFTQVFRDNFFHADMHPGNIFVDVTQPQNPRYIGIDCGIVGSLTEDDKRYLAENFLAFFNRDYHRIAELYIHSGWIPPSTNVIEFENAIRLVCEPVFAKPLAEISLAHLLINLFQTARKFNMEVQPQLVLLEKTLLYVEGLGRQLYPQLDLWTTAKPFLEQWLEQQVGIHAAFKKIKARAPFWNERFPDLPDLVFDTLRQQRQLSYQLQCYLKNEKKNQDERRRSIILTIIAAALFIGGCQLFGSLDKDSFAIMLIICSVLLGSLAWK